MKTVSKSKIDSLKKSIKDMQKQIAKDRDALRDLMDEAEGLEDCCSRAHDDLESAVDALSELV